MNAAKVDGFPADLQNETPGFGLLQFEAAGLSGLLIADFRGAIAVFVRQRERHFQIRLAGSPRVEFLAIEFAVAVFVECLERLIEADFFLRQFKVVVLVVLAG